MVRKGRRKAKATSTPVRFLLRPDFNLRRRCDRLKYARIKSGKSYKEIENKAILLTGTKDGFSRAQIYNDERYDSGLNDLNKFITYSAIYGFTLRWLIEGAAPKRTNHPGKGDIDAINNILAAASPELIRVYRNLIEGVNQEMIKAG